MKQESDSFQFEHTTEWESAGVGVIRQIMAYNKNMMMVQVKFETGAEGAPHTHPHTQATYVVSGIFEFTVGGETEIVRAGDGVYMRSGILHSCKCIETGILIDTFTPMREDFIK